MPDTSWIGILSVSFSVLNTALIVLLWLRFSSTDVRRLIRSVRSKVEETDDTIRYECDRLRSENLDRFRENREELSASLNAMSHQLSGQSADMASSQAAFLGEMMEQLHILRSQLDAQLRDARLEQEERLRAFERVFSEDTAALSELHRQQFADLRTEQERARRAQTETLDKIREETADRLDEMRRTVDEQLQKTVERRFNASFRVISDQLEQVHRGLGEMQQLANGVGDLRRVLTNVKTRGTFGEIQLGAILDQFLSPEQFVRNAHVVPGSASCVEYAVRLPGAEPGVQTLLPVDSKFPVEDYQRVLDASEEPDGQARAARAAAGLDAEIRRCAKEIHDKYIHPPYTTDFAVMFVPSEGLYAEVLRRPGLSEQLQKKYKVTVVGPTNLVAFLSSLQMGFRTLAIEKRSSEVWELLGVVKGEFGRFGDALEKSRRKLEEAARAVETAGTRSRVIERRLQKVEALPAAAKDEMEPIAPSET